MKLAQQNRLYLPGLGAATPGKRRADGSAIAMLPILTGNVGISGGNSVRVNRPTPLPSNACRCWIIRQNVNLLLQLDRCYRSWPANAAIRDGVRGKDKLDVPIKFIGTTREIPWLISILTSTKRMNSAGRIEMRNDCGHRKLYDLTAKYADILLPDLMTVEQEDIFLTTTPVTWDISFSSSLSPAKIRTQTNLLDPE